jgi:hypothetical protein
MLSPYRPTIKGKKTGEVDLKDLAQAVALIEGFLDKVVSSSNLHDTQSQENTPALQGAEVMVDGLLSQVGTKAAKFPKADDAPSLWRVIHSLVSGSEVGNPGAPDPTAVKRVVRQASHEWWESCKGSLVHKDMYRRADG